MIARAREWALRLLLLALSALVALATLEAWIRARDLPPDDATLLRPHPLSPFLVRLEPGASARFTGVSVHANRFGYRGGDWAIPKPEGTVRIAILGDSQTFGYGVRQEDTYPARLERALREARPERAWEVLNFGMMGFNTAQEAEACSLDAFPFHPVVLLLVFFRLDVDPPVRPADVALVSQPGAREQESGWSPSRWHHSLRTPQFLRTRGAALARRLGLRVATSTSRYADLYASRSAAWASCEEALRALRDACARRGARFAVVIIPFIVSLDETYPMKEAHAQVAAFCRDERIPCRDLLPEFLWHSAARLSVSPVNNHMNAEGNRIAAEALASWLLAGGGLDSTLSAAAPSFGAHSP